MRITISLTIIIFFCLSDFLISKNYGILSDSKKSEFFIENKGQWPKEVEFMARLGGRNIWITDFGAVYDYYRIEKSKNETPDNRRFEDPFSENRNNGIIKGHVVRMRFEDASVNPKIGGVDKRKTYFNYFIGSDSTNWASRVPAYGEVVAEDVYPGVDVRYYFDSKPNGGSGKALRYDFLVDPGADLSRIKINFEGQKNIKVTAGGELTIVTSLGEVKHCEIFAFQEFDELGSPARTRREVVAKFRENPDGSVGIIAENYDPDRELIIDPLVWSTFLGGSRNEEIHSIDLDPDGNVLVAGYTESQDFPVDSAAYQKDLARAGDAFVSKLDSNGSELIFSTYFGGDESDYAYKIMLDRNGDIVVGGSTGSENLPVTSGAFDESYNFNTDVFLAKFNPDCSQLLASTYFGGNKNESFGDFDIGDENSIYFVGSTNSEDFPISQNALDSVLNSTQEDAYVAKFDGDFEKLAFSTYLGKYQDDNGYSIKIANSKLFISGTTSSTDFPVTDTLKKSVEAREYFITSLDLSGSSILYSTVFGGSGFDYECKISLINEMIALVGYTESVDFPTTNDALQRVNRGYDDITLTIIDPEKNEVIYSSYFGGSSYDRLQNIYSVGETVYAVGNTPSINFPIIGDALSSEYNSDREGFLFAFDVSKLEFTYSSYLSGNNTDRANAVYADDNSNVYVGGSTFSSDFFVSDEAYNQTVIDDDGFLMKLLLSDVSYTIDPTVAFESEYCPGAEMTIPFDAYPIYNDGNKFTAYFQDVDEDFEPLEIGFVDSRTSDTIVGVVPDVPDKNRMWKVYIESSKPIAKSDDYGGNITIHELPETVIFGNENVLSDSTETYTVTRIPGVTTEWEVSGGYLESGETGDTAKVRWSGTGEAQLIAERYQTQTGCYAYDTLIVMKYSAGTLAANAGNNMEICPRDTVQIGAETPAIGGKPPYFYNWSPAEGLDHPSLPNPLAFPDTTTTYTLTVKDDLNVTVRDSVTIFVFPLPEPEISGSLTASQGESIVYSLETPPGNENVWSASKGMIVETGDSTATVLWTNSGTGKLKAVQTNLLGCSDSTEIEVEIEEVYADDALKVKDYDFGEIPVSDKIFKRGSVLVTNSGTRTLTIDSIAVEGDYFELVEYLDELKPNSSVSLYVDYNPETAGAHVAIIKIFAGDQIGVGFVKGVGITYSDTDSFIGMELSVSPNRGAPGDIVQLTLKVLDADKLEVNSFDYETLIGINSNVLHFDSLPKSVSGNTTVSRDMRNDLSLRIEGTYEGDEILTVVDLEVLLGNEDTTAIVFKESPKIIGTETAVYTTIKDSVFYVDICRAGGDRLLKFKDDESFIDKIKPQPTETGAEIEFFLAERGEIEISLTNIFGEKVWKSREIFSQGYNVTFLNVSDLPSGTYMLTLSSSGNLLDMKKMLIVE